jgi:hypothetical protein
MSFPTVSDTDTTSGTVTSNSSSWTLTYPTNIAAGDLLIALLAIDGTPQRSGGSWPAGWVVAETYSGTSAVELFAGKKEAGGTESGDFSVTLSASEQGSWLVYRIPTATWSGTVGSDWNTTSNVPATMTASEVVGASSTPNPSSLNPSSWDVEDTLWFAVAAADTSRTFSAFPTTPSTFTNTVSLVSGGSGGASLGWGRLESAAASMDPGTFTISSSDDWGAATIAIRPAAAVADTRVPRSTPYPQLLAH